MVFFILPSYTLSHYPYQSSSTLTPLIPTPKVLPHSPLKSPPLFPPPISLPYSPSSFSHPPPVLPAPALQWQSTWSWVVTNYWCSASISGAPDLPPALPPRRHLDLCSSLIPFNLIVMILLHGHSPQLRDYVKLLHNIKHLNCENKSIFQQIINWRLLFQHANV